MQEAPTVQPAQRKPASAARVAAKTMHAFVMMWTALCLFGAASGVARIVALPYVSDAARAFGLTAGLTIWALMWFVLVVAAELFAIGLSLSSPMVTDDATAKREWKIAAAVAAVPVLAFVALTVAGAVLQSVDDSPATELTGDLRSVVKEPVELRCPSPAAGPMNARYTPDGPLVVTFRSYPGYTVARQAADYCEQVLRAGYRVPDRLNVVAEIGDGVGAGRRIDIGR